MKNLIITLAVVIIALTVVSPVHADDGTMPVVCNASHSWLDKMLGNCTDIKSEVKEQAKSLPTMNEMVQAGIDNTEKPFAEIAHTTTESNKVNDAAWSLWDMFESK